MIGKRDRNKIKKIVGGEYSLKVQAILIDQKKTNRLGKPYTIEHIRFVFNGIRDNADIENAIYELVKRKKEAQENRKSILNQ